MNPTILIIDDDVEIAELLKIVLIRHGFNIEIAGDGLLGMQRMYQTSPDLILLDIMMPNQDGWETCRRIRQMANVPIIIVSALDEQEFIIRGLDAGADDFVCKPITPAVILARVQAMLRRVARDNGNDMLNLLIGDQGNVQIDLHKYEVKVDGRRINLSPTEFKLLVTLAKQKGRVLTHNELLKKVWGNDNIGQVDHLRLYIGYLRRKLERDPATPRLIQTEWNVGYRIG